MKYLVKTRNWKCNKTIFHLISLVPHERGDGYTDGDGKFYFESNYLVPALAVWAYWMALKPFSRGWTYIINNQSEKCLEAINSSGYKSMYL